jgi:hypothetical protein
VQGDEDQRRILTTYVGLQRYSPVLISLSHMLFGLFRCNSAHICSNSMGICLAVTLSSLFLCVHPPTTGSNYREVYLV